MTVRLTRIVLWASVLCGVAAGGLWVRSFYRSDLIQYVPRDGWAYTVVVRSGLVGVSSSEEISGIKSNWTSDPVRPGESFGRRFHFGFKNVSAWFVIVPLWAPAAAAAVPAAGAFWYMRRKWLGRQQGLCPTCAYDLRATPGRCPECGWQDVKPAVFGN